MLLLEQLLRIELLFGVCFGFYLVFLACPLKIAAENFLSAPVHCRRGDYIIIVIIEQ